MRKRQKAAGKEVGLGIALIFARYFFKTDYLHYGYWTEGLEVEVGNMRQAQENYANLLISLIPEGAHTILDIGCGSGRFMEELTKRGYTVDGVSPSAMLAAQARSRLAPGQTLFECRFEELHTDKRYDLMLFSESFQYINVDAAARTSLQLLNPGGSMLIADFFGRDIKGHVPLGGGHPLKLFYERMARYPLEKVLDRDITAETAPNLDLVADFMDRVVRPVGQLLFGLAESNHPFLLRVGKLIFRKRIRKMNRRYARNVRTGATFAHYKTYRLLLFRK